MNKRGLVLSEKFLIIIVLLAGLFGLYVMLDQIGAIPSVRSSIGITGLAAGEFSTAEEPLSATPVVNQPPTYLGGSLTTQQDAPLAIDLATLFSDPEGDALTFLATQEDQVSVDISGTVAVFTPASGFAGERTVTIVASDGANLVRQPVKFVVEGTAAPAEEPVSEPEAPVAEEPAPVEQPVLVEEPVPAAPAPEAPPAEPSFGTQTTCGDCGACTTCAATSQECTLTANIAAATTCINVTADNVLIDCAGFNITYGSGGGAATNGVNVRNSTNVTITGCVIRDTNAGGALGAGINFSNTTQSAVLNTTIITNGTNDNYGILLQFGTNNIVIANTTIFARGTSTGNNGIRLTTNVTGVLVENSSITTNGTSSNFGVYFLTFAQNSTVRNTSITTDGSTGTNIGVRIESASNRNVIANNTIVTQRPGEVNNFGVYLVTGVSQNILDGNSIRASGSSGIQGVRLETGAQNNTISNNYIATLGSSSSNFGIYLVTNARNNTIIGNAVNASGTSSTMGIRLESTATNNTIADNVVRTNGSGASNYGIHLVTTALNNSVINNTVSANGTTDIDGIRLEATANGNMVINNTISVNGPSGGNRGIVLFNTALNNQIINNSVSTNGSSVNYGILLITVTDNNTLILNTVSTAGADSYGIRLDNSQGITLMNNSIVTATDGLFIEGTEFIHFTTNNITAGNTINGSPIQYYGGAGQSPACPDNSVLSAPTARHFAFINCVNVTLENYDAYDIVTLVNAKNMTVTGSRFRDNKYGIRVLDGTGALIANNNITANTSTFTDNYGIYFAKTAQNSTIRGNNVTTLGVGTQNYGIYLDGNSSNNTIADGFVQTGGTTNNHGIRMERGSNNVTVMNMTVRTGGTNNNYGIVAFTSVSGTMVANTTVMTNGTSTSNYGVYLLTFAQNSTVINNTIIADGAGGSNLGVRIESASNRNVIANNTIVTQRPGTTNNFGVSLATGVSLNRIDNNTIRASGSSGIQGVRLESGAQNNTISNNYIATLGSSSSNFGIYLVTNANNNTVTGNVVNASGTSSTMGIRLESVANNNTVANNIVRTNGSSSSNYGIYLVTNALNNSIINNTVSANGTTDNDGIRLEGTANNNRVINNTVSANGPSGGNRGIVLFNTALNNQIINNSLSTNGSTVNYGILLTTITDNNTLILNTISTVGADSYGIRIDSAQGITLMNNSIQTPYDGLFIEGTALIHFNTHNITADNLVNGSPIQYYGGPGQSPACPNNTILSSPNAAHIDFIGCGNVTLTGYNAFDIITLVGANNITINHSQSIGNKYGFRLLFGAGGNTIANNNISANTTTFTDNYGILLQTLVHNNTIAFNNITTMGVGANNYGIYLFNASNNTLLSNGVNTSGTSNNNGIRIEGRANNNSVVNNTVNAKGTSSANYGIVLFSSVSDNAVINNTITTNGTTANYGIYVVTFAQNSTVEGNTVVAEGTSGSNNGIRLENTANANRVANNMVTVGPPGTTNNFGIQAVTGISWNTIVGNTVLTRGTTGAHGIILQAGAQNSTVANNVVTSAGSASGARGIYLLTTVRNVTVVNNTVNVSGTSTIIGISLESTVNNVSVVNNTVRVNASSSTIRGINLDTTALDNNITGNTVIVNGTTGVNGIRLDTTANNNRFDNNNVSASGTNAYGIEFVSSAGNQFNRTVLTNPPLWLQSGATSTNNFTNTTFTVPGNGSIAVYGMFQLNATREIARTKLNITANKAFLNSTNLTFLNQSAEIALFNVAAGDPRPTVDIEDDGTFVDCAACTELSYAGNVYVFNTTGFTSYSWAESGLNVSLTKTDSPDPVTAGTSLTYQISFVVNSGNASNITLTDTYPPQVVFLTAQPTPITGTNNTFILGNLTEGMTFTVNITVQVLLNAAGQTVNNSANATFQNQTGAAITLNVTEGTLTLALPFITQVILNTTNPLTNDTNQNLTVFIINVTHPANATVHNITDLRRNGTSITVLNLPFENITTSTGSGAVRSYDTFATNATLGSTTSAPTWNNTAGMVGGAYSFDGSNDFMSASAPAPTLPLTFEFWVKPNDASPVGIFDTAPSVGGVLRNFPGGSVEWHSGDPSVSLGLTASQWAHVVLVFHYDGNRHITYYRNGTRVVTANGSTSSAFAWSSPIRFGDINSGSAGRYTGAISEIRIYNRSLAQADVTHLYTEGLSGRRISVLDANQTTKGDVWQACVTPNDNQTDGTTVCSNNVTVQSYPPVIAQVILNSTNPLTNDTNQNLTAFIINATDTDGDAIKNITDWRVGGTSISVLNMPFEAGSSNSTATMDYSVFENDGIVSGASFRPTEGFDDFGVYVFDGVNDNISIANSSDFAFGTGNFSITAWINTTASPTACWRAIISVGNGHLTADAISIYAPGTGAVPVGSVAVILDGVNPTMNSVTLVNNGAWYFIALTKNGSTAFLYVNGTQEDTATTSIDVPSHPVHIGTTPDCSTYFGGGIDEVRVYNRTLSPEQVLALFNNRTNLIVSQQTSVGENWSVAVTPNDNTENGTTVLSNNVTIRDVQAGGNTAPVIAQVILNTTNVSTNDTNQNLTLFVINATDADGHVVQNITDFRINGTSWAILNMPFEKNMSNLSAGIIRDYGTFRNNGTLGNGTAQSAPVWNNSGRLGGAYLFDGINDTIEIPHSSSLTFDDNFTATVWMRLNTSQASIALSKRIGAPTFNQWSLGVVDTSGCAGTFTPAGTAFCLLMCNGGTCTGTASANGYADNRFHFVTAVRSGTLYSLYVDGAFASSATRTGDISNTRAFVIGNIGDLAPDFGFAFNGTIDEVIIYNRSLSAAQINQLYVDGNASRRSLTIVKNELSVGQNWSACVTPNDNQTDGTTVCSNNVTILDVVADANDAPVIAQVILNTTNVSTNDTNQNLTVFIINATDADNHVVQNITDWRVNNRSLALLNLPFETDQTGNITSGAIRDYGTFGSNGTLGDGTASQAPIWNNTDLIGGAYAFDGSNDLITVPDSPIWIFGTNNFTMDLWVNFKVVNAGGQGSIPNNFIAQDEGGGATNKWIFTLSTSPAVLSFHVNNPGAGINTFLADTTFSPVTNRWYHLAVRRNGTTFTIYVNGTKGGTEELTGALPDAAAKVQVSSSEGIGFINGQMDEVHIWNRSLSDEEIALIYREGNESRRRVQTFVAQDTTTGEVWQTCVTPNDNQTDGNTTCSNNVTIQDVVADANDAPVIAQVILNSTNPLTNDTNQNLTLFILNATDADNNVVQNITDWRVNNRSIAVLNMPFENGTNATTIGAVRDYSIFGNNGTLGNGSAANVPQWRYVGKGGGAYVFDGLGDRINIADSDSLSLTQNITIEAWVNITDFVNFQVIIAKRVASALDYQLTIARDGESDARQMRFDWGGGAIQTAIGTTDLTANRTHHVVVTFNNTFVQFYLDGVNDGSATTATALTDSANVIEIGHDVVSASPGIADFKGAIAAVRVYNRTLSLEQIREIFIAENASRTATVIVHNETQTGNIWSACVTPNDNQTDGNTTCSNNVTIQDAVADANDAPAIAQVILNTTNPLTNDTNQNLTVFIINATDADNNVVQNITDWRRNATSIAIVNMPFETNASSGMVRDYSTFLNNGTLGDGVASQIPVWTAGRVGGAYSFDGINDRINISTPTGNFGTSDFTVEFWLNTSYTANVMAVIGKRTVCVHASFWEVRMLANGSLLGVVDQDGAGTNFAITYTGSVNDGRFHHIAMNRRGSVLDMFIDGVLNTTSSGAGTADISNAANLSIGSNPCDGVSGETALNGTIDEVIIYNRSLSAQQIQLDYLRGNASQRINVIARNETIAGDVWSACATPNDNQTDGNTTCSNNVTVNAVQNNTAPSIAQVILNSTNPLTNDSNQNLTLYIINATDANNDTVQNITDFRINGTSIAVLNLPFENNTANTSAGYIRDYTTFGNNATLGAGVVGESPLWNNSGRMGGMYAFDGIDDLITVADAASLKPVNNISIEFWMNLTGQVGVTAGGAPAGHQYILHKPRAIGVGCFEGYTFSKSSAAKVGFTATGTNGCGEQTGIETTSSVATGIWYQVVGTFDGQRMRIYLNGTLEASAAHAFALAYTAAPLVIGQTNDFFDGSFNGTISEVRIYNRNLSDEQVSRLFADGTANRRPTVIVAQETLTGENWSACVTPNDNQTDGNTTCSNNVTIQEVFVAPNVVPSIAQVILNSTNPSTNDTNQNLTVFVINATDGNNDTVQNITDFRRNGTSIAVLNLPFETNATISVGNAIRDYSTFANNGTLGSGTAAPFWNQSGKVGSSYTFDGADDFIQFNDSTSLNITGSQLTLEAWINTPEAIGGGFDRIVVKEVAGNADPFLRYGFFRTGGAGTVNFGVSTGGAGTLTGVVSNFSIPTSTWIHMVGTYDGALLRLYMNGELNNSVAKTGAIGDTLRPFILGGNTEISSEFYNGHLDEVRVYNRTLNAAQVRLNYLDGLANRSMRSIAGGMTAAGDVWQACATPNDNRTDGNTTCSNNVTIQQAPPDLNFSPSIAQVILNTTNPLTNDTNQNLTVFVINATDGDNDTVQNITDWRVNNRSIATLHWPFETSTSSLSTGAIRDYSIFGNNGTLGAGVSGQAPVWNNTNFIGGAYVYDGSNDFITTPNATSIDFSSLFTMEAWGFRATSAGTMHVMGKRLGCSGSDLQYQMAFDGSGFQLSGVAVNIGSWTHMVTVFNGTHYLNYLNGTFVGSFTGSAPVPVSGDFKVGASGSCGSTWAGTLDEISLYDRALSAAQVMQNYLDGNMSRRITTIVRQELNASQVWQACVTPNDNNLTGMTGDGNTTCSNNVTIQEVQAGGNTAPVIAQVILNSTNLSTNDTFQNLTLFIINATDADNNPVANITNWFVNNQSVLLLNVPFEGGSNSTFTRDYALGINGSVQGATFNDTKGPDGFGAYNFSGGAGTSGPIKFGNTSAHRPQFLTLEAWVNVTTFTTFAGIVTNVYDSGSVESGYGLLLTTSGVFFTLVPDTGAGATYLSSGAVMTAGRWHHVAGTFDGLTMRVYVDGIERATQALVAGIDYVPTNNLTVGAYLDNDENFGFSGTIGVVRVYNRTLTAQEILALNQSRNDSGKAASFTAANTFEGEVWRADVTPNDRAVDGATVQSNNVTILASPSIAQVILNSTNPLTNDTNQNLTVFFVNVSDMQNASVQNVTDWRVNNVSIAVIYAPFETSTNGTPTNIIRSYSTNVTAILIGNDSASGRPFWNATGRVGAAYRFDGSNDFIETPTMDIGSNFTVELWLIPQSATSFQHLVSNHFTATRYGALYWTGDHIEYWMGGSLRASSGAGTVGQNAWSHVALAYNGSIATIYINGTAAGSSSAITTTLNNSLRIGAAIPFESSTLSGFMDEVRIYNRVLSVDQLRQNYALGNASRRMTVLVHNETVTGENWIVAVTPNDNETDGATVLSNSVTIAAAAAAPNVTTCPQVINVSTTLSSNLSANLSDDQLCIRFGNNSMFFDCAGFAILGNGSGRAILAANLTNMTVRNCEVRHFRENIVLDNVTGGAILNVTSLNGSRWAIAVLNGRNVVVANSTASQAPVAGGSTVPAAIFLNNTNASLVATNNASGQSGILLGGFENELNFHVVVRDNNATSGSGTAFGTSDSAQVNITYVNNRGTTNGTNAFGLSLNDSLFVNNTGGSTGTNEAFGLHGIFLRQGKNNNVTGNNGTSLHGVGILLRDVANTTLADSAGIANRSAGIRITRGANVTLLRSNGASNFSVGISLQHGRENVVRNSIGRGELLPVVAGGGGGATGISLENVSFTVLVNSIGISNASNGIALSNGSSFNNLTGNNGTSNFSAGILLSQNSDNNTFVNNTAYSLNNVALNLSGVAGNVLRNNTFGVNNGTAVLFSGVAVNNVFGNSTLYANGTWLFSGSSASGNNLTNTLFEGQNGSIRILPNTTMPVSVNVSVRTLNISYNASFLNGTAHGFLNLSSQVTLRNLTQSNPEPVSDFEDDGTFVTCPVSICQEVSYAGGVFVFNVTGFTTHAAGETPAVINNVSNLSVIKTDSPDPVNSSANLTYVINVTIIGNGTAYNVTVNDTYPPQVIFLAAQPTPLAGTNNTFILGNLTPNTSILVNVTVLTLNVSNGTVINNSVNVSFQNETSALLSAVDTENTTVLAAVAAAGGACPIILNVSTTLTQNIVCNETAIIIANSSLALNCAGFSVTYDTAGVGGDGVQSNNTQNVTVRNCAIRDGNASGAFGIGINFTAVNNSLILNSTVITNGTAENYGVFLFTRSIGNRVVNNSITAQGSGAANYGIYALANSAFNNITGNTVRTNGSTGNYGVHIRNSSGSTIIANNSINTRGDAETNVGVNVLNSSDMTIMSNSIQTNGTVNNFGIILQFNVAASVVANNTVSANGNDTLNFGIYLVQDVGWNNITGNTVTTSGTTLNIGIDMERNATHNLVQGNIVTTQGSVSQNHAIRLIDASFANVTGNTLTAGGATGTTNQGVRILQSDNTTVAQNTVVTIGTGSSAGITLLSNISSGLVFNNSVTTGNGVFDEGINILLNASGVHVIGNTVVANGTRGSNGITIESDASGNLIANNTITSAGNDTSFGIWLQQNASNNQFINNTIVTGGVFNNHGISIESGSNDNRISFTTITTTGSASYGISINNSNGTNFTNTRLIFPTEWIVTGADTFTNLTNTTFEQPNGSIAITALARANGTQNVTKAKLNITFNRAFLNSSNLSFLNVTGIVTLNNITSTDPQPIVDFEDDGTFSVCASTADPFCTELGYAGGVFTYNASHFTTYSSNETSAAAPAPSPGQGGGSGGGGAGGVRRAVEQPSNIISEVCNEQWVCGGWTACVNDMQSRECADLRACNTTYARPSLERACTPEEAPVAEQPLILLQPLKPFVALFRANLWLLVFVVLGIVLLTMASWQVGQHRGAYGAPQLVLRLPEHDHGRRLPAGRPREKKHFYKSLDNLDRQLADLDRGKVPARLKPALRQVLPVAVPKQSAAEPVRVVPRKPGVFDRIARRIDRITSRRAPESKPVQVRPAVLKPVRLPVVEKPKLPARIAPQDQKRFYGSLDALDKQLGTLDRKRPAIKPPHVVPKLAVERREPIVRPVSAPKPFVVPRDKKFEGLLSRLSKKLTSFERARTEEPRIAPHTARVPKLKPVVLKPLRVPKPHRAHPSDEKQFYGSLDALDKRLGALDRKRPQVKLFKPPRAEHVLPARAPVVSKPLPAPAKPAQVRPDAFDRKLREAMRAKIEPLPPKKAPEQHVLAVPKGQGLYDRIMKRMQKIAVAPEPRVESPKQVQKPAQPKQVRLPSMQDIKRAALHARVRKSEDCEDFRKTLRSFDDELDKLDKKMKKKAK